MTLERRVTAILSSPKPGAAPQVRTSAAFAARFAAEANRSGLSIDLAEKDAGQMVRICPVCGAQNSRFVTACFNCQTELDTREAAPAPVQQALRHQLPEARWHLIIGTPRLSTLPLLASPPVRARFAAPPDVPDLDPAKVLGRFLSVFVEREEQRPPPKSVARFDERTMFDKFLSVFVERQ